MTALELAGRQQGGVHMGPHHLLSSLACTTSAALPLQVARLPRSCADALIKRFGEPPGRPARLCACCLESDEAEASMSHSCRTLSVKQASPNVP